jgi:hypothetical protein
VLSKSPVPVYANLSQQFVLKVELYRPDAPIPRIQPCTPPGPPQGTPFPPPVRARRTAMPQVLSVTGRSMMPMPSYHSYGSNDMYSTVPRRGRNQYGGHGGHGGNNQVIIERIERGRDVRTTVSLLPYPGSTAEKVTGDATKHSQ